MAKCHEQNIGESKENMIYKFKENASNTNLL
jgi:hypothetical protein